MREGIPTKVEISDHWTDAGRKLFLAEVTVTPDHLRTFPRLMIEVPDQGNVEANVQEARRSPVAVGSRTACYSPRRVTSAAREGATPASVHGAAPARSVVWFLREAAALRCLRDRSRAVRRRLGWTARADPFYEDLRIRHAQAVIRPDDGLAIMRSLERSRADAELAL
jgi:hypothetical protein